MTRDCFELESLFWAFTSPTGCCVGFATGLADDASVRFFADFAIEILRSVHGGVAPPPPKPHLGQQAGGAGSRSALASGIADSTAPIATECQSFLDNVVAQFGGI
jgi:hypothetical protein